jgi:hypothetical protein
MEDTFPHYGVMFRQMVIDDPIIGREIWNTSRKSVSMYDSVGVGRTLIL